ncbi:hypothetical protein KAFR_0A02170 [Kazachstania africana CBS 2517]|uniref:Mannan endo-1,6-alpha-mannosidase n=1 Tax=Kazachstania africana (strain ATCC 22294 / BCRC 22015 / CBS 2517 / CECT 1963 / NBRC 1671 / NRRL Y-8276) TaxID=1071382 RepID=H2AMQ5_KAZAF|nr:hypothetical protein KAFR_0A02170 [Kazachstania africana CBS 2517]CCF55655.1 hypothetical protein KAFR_0A02170 [Kazachstania africana CBS 2517]
MIPRIKTFALILSTLIWRSQSLELDLDDYQSLQNATALVAWGLMDYYEGTKYGGTVGMFSSPYYWWEAGGAFGTLLDFWYFMDNDTYNDEILAAMVYQAGNDWDYIPLNQSTTEGNDDQAFWGIAAMTAAERNFTNPASDEPQWLYLAQAVFNTMALRWDTDSCGGGLRWQIFTWNSGYDYKNSVSNGALFHLAARLARYTGNDSYVDWAEKVYNWMEDTGFITTGNTLYVYDGASTEDNCSSVTKYQWTYNQGLILSGAAYLYNYSESSLWYNRTMTALSSSGVFLNNSIMCEAACQPAGTCDTDQRSFKAYFARFLGVTAQLVPSTRTQIMTWMNASAYAVAESCSGGTDGHTCGLNWFLGSWDGYYGLGEQMSALEVLVNTRALDKPGPYNSTNGGSSQGDGAAGTETTATNLAPLNITGGSKAAAAIITAVIGISLIACTLWIIF